MKTAAKVMYILGTIFAIIGLIAGVIMLGSGLISYFMGEDEDVKMAGMTLVISGAVITFIYFLVTILGTWGRKAIGNRKTNLAPHILSIVLGACSADCFFLLGGIFGLVAESYGNH